jgi:hypothetical protein
LKYAVDPAPIHPRYAAGEIDRQPLTAQDIRAPCYDDVPDQRHGPHAADTGGRELLWSWTRKNISRAILTRVELNLRIQALQNPIRVGGKNEVFVSRFLHANLNILF